MSYAAQHLKKAASIIQKIDADTIEKARILLGGVKESGGRLFFLGARGTAGNRSHAVNDFRKTVGTQSYNFVPRTTYRSGRPYQRLRGDFFFVEWLRISRLSAKDAVFIFSVGGGNLDKNISAHLPCFAARQEHRCQNRRMVGRDRSTPPSSPMPRDPAHD